MATLKGAAHVYGSDVDTDAIIPARYLNVSEPQLLAAHCMENIDPAFRKRVMVGDIMVAGTNFGCGSSREHAPIAIKACGISCVVAKSFARIFFRNAINIGLPLLECPEAVDSCAAGDTLEVDLSAGRISNVTRGLSYVAKPYPEFMMAIINAGGLIAHTIRRLEGKNA
ncbi:MAG: 3-isopropylmalate dehydratase small subunit [Dehalococcoidia bacterium]|nr:3-isopropylmalate dehydratase small subunit [Dehalococcoidia bacterium]